MPKIIAMLALVILAGASLVGCTLQAPSNKTATTPTPVVMRLGYLPLAQPLLIAEAKGLFKQAGLQVELHKGAGANALLDGLVRGDLDGIGSVAYASLFALEQRAPNEVRLTFGAVEYPDTGFSSLIVKKGSGITAPEGLKGRTVVMRNDTSSRLQAEALFKQWGLATTEVTILGVEAGLLVPTFAKPEVAAFLDVEPFGTMIIEQGLGERLIMSPRTQIVSPYPLGGGVLRRAFVEEHPEEARKFRAVMESAMVYARAHEVEAREIWQRALKLEPAIASKMRLARFETVADINREALGRLADFHVTHGIIKNKPQLERWFLWP